MHLIKKIILLLSLFCVAMPARAMDAKSVFEEAVTIGLFYLLYKVTSTVIEDRKASRWISVATDPNLEKTKTIIEKRKGYPKERYWLDAGTPLHYAASLGHTEKAKLLLAHGADVDARNDYDATPLHHAAHHGHTEIVKLLVTHGANCIAVNKWGTSPLMLAAANGHREAVRCILQHAPFNPITKSTNSESRARITALVVCMRNNKLPRDICNTIIAYLNGEILNQEHCKLAYNYGADLGIVAQYPLEWLLSIYDTTERCEKPAFLNAIVPAITAYRMRKVRELLANPIHTTDPVISAMLNVANIEQHRPAIEANVRNAFTYRVLEKRPNLRLVNVNQGVQEVMNSNLQQNPTRD